MDLIKLIYSIFFLIVIVRNHAVLLRVLLFLGLSPGSFLLNFRNWSVCEIHTLEFLSFMHGCFSVFPCFISYLVVFYT
jgi:hypothetical protein